MQPILNLTQHVATPEQLAAGVFEPLEHTKEEIRGLMTFDKLPSRSKIIGRSKHLSTIAAKYAYFPSNGERAHVMIGGAGFLMSVLERDLQFHGIRSLYAFSVRDSIEETLPDGGVVKRAVFRHLGFVANEAH